MLETPERWGPQSLSLWVEEASPSVLVVLGTLSIVTGQTIALQGPKILQVHGLEGLLCDLWIASLASVWVVIFFPVRWNCAPPSHNLFVAVVSPKVGPLHPGLV